MIRMSLILLVPSVLLQHGIPAANSDTKGANDLERRQQGSLLAMSEMARDIQSLETAVETVYSSENAAVADKELLASLARAEESLSQLYNLAGKVEEGRQMDDILNDLLARAGRALLDAAVRVAAEAALNMAKDLLAKAAKAVAKRLKGLDKKKETEKGEGQERKKRRQEEGCFKRRQGWQGGEKGSKEGRQKGREEGREERRQEGRRQIERNDTKLSNNFINTMCFNQVLKLNCTK